MQKITMNSKNCQWPDKLARMSGANFAGHLPRPLMFAAALLRTAPTAAGGEAAVRSRPDRVTLRVTAPVRSGPAGLGYTCTSELHVRKA
jgi:hypothetical protein